MVSQKAVINKTTAEITAFMEDLMKQPTPAGQDQSDSRLELIQQVVNKAVTLNEEERRVLHHILIMCIKAIYEPGTPLPATMIAKHAIPMINESRAVHCKERPMARSEVQQAIEVIDALVSKEVLQRCQQGSAYNTPVKLVAKKAAGKLRLVSTFVRLNSASALTSLFPMGRIDDIITTVAGMPILSTIDFQDGYYQILMKDSDRCKTAFMITNVGQYEYVRMAQGLAGAPATWNFVMNEALGHLRELHVDGKRGSVCHLFVDDLLMGSANNMIQLFHLYQVLKQLIRCNLVVSGAKLNLFQKSVKYCGKTIDELGTKPSEDHLARLRNYPKPQTDKERGTFVGLINYMGDYIDREKHMLEPIKNMEVKGKGELVWTQEAEDAFVQLKNSISDETRNSAPKYGDATEIFVLTTDASNFALGAVLWQMQKDDQGTLKRMLISHGSRSMSKAERNYPIAEKEALAVIFGLEKYRRHILGHPVKLQTDHSALKHCFDRGDSNNSRLARWLLIIQEYKITEIEYIAGHTNVGADFLSRLPGLENLSQEEQLFSERLYMQAWCANQNTREDVEQLINKHEAGAEGIHGDEIIAICQQLLVTEDEFRTAQLADLECGPILKYLEEPSTVTTDEIKNKARHFIVVGKRLFRISSPRQRLVVPTVYRSVIMAQCHDEASGGHLSATPTFERMRLSYYWEGMYASVVQYIQGCQSCKAFKNGTATSVHIKPLAEGVQHPFHTINIDVKGPLPATASGNQYIISMLCVRTNWVEAYATKNQKTKTIQTCLTDLITRHGVPRIIICDRGASFTSSGFKALVKAWGIKCDPHEPYAHWMSGSVERFHASISNILQHYLNAYRTNWDVQLPFALFAYRIAFQGRLHTSPFFQLYGRQPETPDTVSADLPEIIDNDARDLSGRMEEAIAIAQRNHKDVSTTTHVNKTINVGQWVRVRAPTTPGKMAPRWNGPFEVTQVSDRAIRYIGHLKIEQDASRDNVKL